MNSLKTFKGQAMGLLLCLIMATLPGLCHGEGNIGFAITLKDQVNFRQDPGGKSLDKLAAGTAVFVLEEAADPDGNLWCYVNAQHGKTNRHGWIRRDMLQTTADAFTDITQISASQYMLLGLKSDGTAIAMGDPLHRATDIATWQDLITLEAGFATALGLTKDGRLLLRGLYENTDFFMQHLQWETFQDVSMYTDGFAALLSTGGIAWVGSPFWQEGPDVVSHEDAFTAGITAIDGGWGFLLGLKADGRPVATGRNHMGQCDVWELKDVIAIAAGQEHSVFLHGDGTVSARGQNSEGQCEVDGWQDIVSIAAGPFHTLGVKRDGTVLATGRNDQGQCDVTNWRDITMAACAETYSAGLMEDGRVVVVGGYTFTDK